MSGFFLVTMNERFFIELTDNDGVVQRFWLPDFQREWTLRQDKEFSRTLKAMLAGTDITALEEQNILGLIQTIVESDDVPRLLACALLPESEKRFNPDTIAAREALFENITNAQLQEVVQRFFDSGARLLAGVSPTSSQTTEAANKQAMTAIG